MVAIRTLLTNLTPLQGRSQDIEKGEANVTQGGAEGTYS